MSNEEKQGETLVSVPVDGATKAWLEARADANGRATGREAQQILKAAQAADEAAVQCGEA